jgi:hypothetical protein
LGAFPTCHEGGDITFGESEGCEDYEKTSCRRFLKISTEIIGVVVASQSSSMAAGLNATGKGERSRPDENREADPEDMLYRALKENYEP